MTIELHGPKGLVRTVAIRYPGAFIEEACDYGARISPYYVPVVRIYELVTLRRADYRGLRRSTDFPELTQKLDPKRLPA